MIRLRIKARPVQLRLRAAAIRLIVPPARGDLRRAVLNGRRMVANGRTVIASVPP